MTTQPTPIQPLIGLTTYRKTIGQNPAPFFSLMTSYVEAVAAAGGAPLLIPLGLDEATLRGVLARLDGLVLTGGGDIAGEHYRSAHPELIFDIDTDRDRVEMFLAREALDRDKPLLAICRGHQMLNVALGGSLFEDVMKCMPGAIRHDFFTVFPRNHQAHAVTVTPGSRLAEALGGHDVRVNSLHHQGIRELAGGLVAVAHAPDGLIEGVEAPGQRFALGVQWHPENLIHDVPRMMGLFTGLIGAADGGHDGR